MLYGSSRLGLWERNKKLTFTPVTETIQSVYRGDKRYELSDHLGNVHVVLTDRKELHCGLEDNVPFPEYYTAEVKNRYDYYPFGMLMEERKYSAPGCIYDTDTLFTLVFADYFSAPVADWYYLDGFFNPTVSGGYMHLDQPDNTLFKLITPTVIGKQYRVRFGVDMNGCDSARVAGNVQGLTMQTFTSSGDHVFYFSSNDSMYSGVSFYVDAPCDVLIDYVIVEEMDISSTVVCDSNAALAYRYGFNSMPKDDEIYEIEGTEYDFGARLYDSRLGRFFSVDPMASGYPMWSPYSFAIDNPIKFIDVNGNGPGDGLLRTYTTVIELPNGKKIYAAKRYYRNVTAAQVENYGREALTPNGWYLISKREYEIQNGGTRTLSDGSEIATGTPNPDAFTYRVYGADTPQQDQEWQGGIAGSFMNGEPLGVSRATGIASLDFTEGESATEPTQQTITFSIHDPEGNILSSEQKSLVGSGILTFDYKIPDGGFISFNTSAYDDPSVVGAYSPKIYIPSRKGSERTPDNIDLYGMEAPTEQDIEVLSNYSNGK